MDQKLILVILMICHEMTSGAVIDRAVKEGKSVQINCEPLEMGHMVIWFRHLDTTGMEFIASFTNNGMPKSTENSISKLFRPSTSRPISLTLQSFNQIRDSGVYSCASLKGNKMIFGNPTRLFLEKVEVTVEVTSQATEQTKCTTSSPCVCESVVNKPGETSPEMFCSLIILGPLAGGCGLLLLLLIITSVYCNHVRTRRCPHHYKRKPVMAPGKQLMMTNSHV
ncbi:T-cell surface glycoprotein CD8 alpha chain [Notothenia coriiceps]|uniref:T-cell surface glycoprotein CD8 alpha chain n=1 Tax=Notothenia coriiceps TaxID=8208 RepID=A0A6I9PV85_9TELE|nr:PREDICTED: T-cell surface glycoprotein CD8 alpha chain [Notothenia coriiceps]